MSDTNQPPIFNVRFPSLEAFEKEVRNNISKGGFFLKTKQVKPLRSIIEMRFHLPEKSKPISLKGEIVHVVSPDQPTTGMGPGMAVQFLNFDDNVVEELQTTITRLKTSVEQVAPEPESPEQDEKKIEDDEDYLDSGDEDDQEKTSSSDQSNIFAYIRSKSLTDKIKLAKRGNRAERNVLIQEGNKQILRFILQNPKLTAIEVVQVLKMPQTNLEAIQTISKDSRWMQNEEVRYHIVTCPKSPLPVALTALNSLNLKNLGAIAKSRNVKAQVKSNALKLLEKRRGSGG